MDPEEEETEHEDEEPLSPSRFKAPDLPRCLKRQVAFFLKEQYEATH